MVENNCRPMTIDGRSVPTDAIAAAVVWIRNPLNSGFNLANIKSVMTKAGCPFAQSERAADRLLQRERKAGRIRFSGGYWWNGQQ